MSSEQSRSGSPGQEAIAEAGRVPGPPADRAAGTATAAAQAQAHGADARSGSGSELHPALAPLQFLIGRWEGAGVVGYPTISSANFGRSEEHTSGLQSLRHLDWPVL